MDGLLSGGVILGGREPLAGHTPPCNTLCSLTIVGSSRATFSLLHVCVREKKVDRKGAIELVWLCIDLYVVCLIYREGNSLSFCGCVFIYLSMYLSTL